MSDIEIRREARPVWIVAGRAFSYEPDAQAYRARLLLEKWAEEIGLSSGGEWDREMILSAILEMPDELTAALDTVRTPEGRMVGKDLNEL